MKVAKTLYHKITNHSHIFGPTLAIYNDALAFIINVIDSELDNVDEISTRSIVPAVEKLIHTTKSNPLPKYKASNARFHKFPSYFRRGVIATALGEVKSHRSSLRNWNEERVLALRKAEELEISEQRYKSLFEYHLDAVYSLDLEGRFISVNNACANLLGQDKEKLIGC